MAIFSKQDPRTRKPQDRVASSVRGAAADGAISIIAPGMVVTGNVVTEGIVRVEGEVVGTVKAAKAVILGQSGRVDGDVYTEDAVIGGTVTGTIIAGNRVELQSTCAVFGEIRARPHCLKLDEGARFAGEIKLVDAEDPLGGIEGETAPNARDGAARRSAPGVIRDGHAPPDRHDDEAAGSEAAERVA